MRKSKVIKKEVFPGQRLKLTLSCGHTLIGSSRRALHWNITAIDCHKCFNLDKEKQDAAETP